MLSIAPCAKGWGLRLCPDTAAFQKFFPFYAFVASRKGMKALRTSDVVGVRGVSRVSARYAYVTRQKTPPSPHRILTGGLPRVVCVRSTTVLACPSRSRFFGLLLFKILNLLRPIKSTPLAWLEQKSTPRYRLRDHIIDSAIFRGFRYRLRSLSIDSARSPRVWYFTPTPATHTERQNGKARSYRE